MPAVQCAPQLAAPVARRRPSLVKTSDLPAFGVLGRHHPQLFAIATTEVMAV